MHAYSLFSRKNHHFVQFWTFEETEQFHLSSSPCRHCRCSYWYVTLQGFRKVCFSKVCFEVSWFHWKYWFCSTFQKSEQNWTKCTRRMKIFVGKIKKFVSLAFQQTQPFQNRTNSLYKRVSRSWVFSVFFQRKHIILAAGIPSDFQRKTLFFPKNLELCQTVTQVLMNGS